MARTYMFAEMPCAWQKTSSVALIDVIAEHGKRRPAEAVNFLAELKKLGRYQTDVY